MADDGQLDAQLTSLPPSVAWTLLAVALTAAAWDLRFRKIPNWLSLTGLAAGVSLNCILGGWAGATRSLEGIGAAFGIYFLLYLARAMGAGDVKFMAAVGALAGPRNWMAIFLITALVGGVIALAVVTWRGRLRRTLENVWFIGGELLRFRAPHLGREELSVRGAGAVTLPHGAAIALGCAIFLYFN